MFGTRDEATSRSAIGIASNSRSLVHLTRGSLPGQTTGVGWLGPQVDRAMAAIR